MRWALGGFVQIDERSAQVASKLGKTECKVQGRFVPNLPKIWQKFTQFKSLKALEIYFGVGN
jgi:hypothetical protein